MGFPCFLIFCIGGSVFLAWLFNSTGGSLLLVTLFHGAFGTGMQLLVDPIDAQPLRMMAGLVAVSAALVAVATRGRLGLTPGLRRGAASELPQHAHVGAASSEMQNSDTPRT